MNTDDLLAVYVVLSTKGKRKRAISWTKDWLLKREQLGCTHLLRELLPYLEDVHTFLRMDENSYLELLDLVRPRIEKQSTVLRSPIDLTPEINALYFILQKRTLSLPLSLSLSLSLNKEAFSPLSVST